MPSVHIEGFIIAIRTDDHAPAHAHVIRNGANYRFYLSGKRKPEPVAGRMSVSDMRKAARIVQEHRDTLIAMWRRYHRDKELAR